MKGGPNPRLFIALALGTLIGGAAIIYMEWTVVSDGQAKIAALQKDRKDPKTVKAELTQSQTDLEQIRDKVRHLEAGIPAHAYVPTMLKELEEDGRRQGIQVLGIRPIPPKADPAAKKAALTKPYDELDIEVKGRGAYADAVRFLRSLDTFPKIVAVRAIAMEPKTDPSHGGTSLGLDITVTLRAYLFKETAKTTSSTTEVRL